jgi:hypothetical protein
MSKAARILPALFACSILFPLQGPARAQDKKPTFVGADKCKLCHLSQHQTWLKSKHAQALQVLGDKRNDPSCLPCHTTGLTGPKDPAASDLGGVQCEACHGAGSLYKSPALMSKTKYTQRPEQARKDVIAAGLTLPDEKVCTSCHNSKSPTFKGFDFATYREKIKHWD